MNGATTSVQERFAEALRHYQNGRIITAEGLCRKNLAIDPRHADSLNLLGAIAYQAGRHGQAVARIARAVTMNFRDASFHSNLGLALQEQGHLDAAINSYSRAIDLKRDYAEAHYNLGNAFKTLRNVDEAIANYRSALLLKPNLAEAHNNLGDTLSERGLLDEAIFCFRRAIKLKPDYPDAGSNLGNALWVQRRSREALTACRYALTQNPAFSDALNNLAVALQEQGSLFEAELYYGRAFSVKPASNSALSNMLLCMNYADDVDIDSYGERHARFGELLEGALVGRHRPHDFAPSDGRRLRVGYVSPDFRMHSVAYFIEPLLRGHDRSRFEIYCYGEVKVPDAMTARLRALIDVWVSTVGLSDDSLAERIRADGIDILVDLAGHTAGNRLPVFARKPAPVQLTWLGYGATTGLTAIDYRLTDRWLTPEGGGERFTEKLWRLPCCSMVFSPPPQAPAVAPLPFDRNGYITFGSFNNLSKVTAATIALWSGALQAVPNSRLTVKAKQSGDKEVMCRLERAFAAHGVSPDRLIWCDYAADIESHLAEYGRVDIALDSFPYGGGTTTCEALWMGVPVVTLAGDRLVSRLGLSYLGALGLEDLAAAAPGEFAAIAKSLAADVATLRDMREALRDRMVVSSLCDGAKFARAIESAYVAMWEQWTGA